MVLDTGNNAIPIERDVRETPTVAALEAEYQESTAAQNLTGAGGWTDVTGATITLTLESARSLLIMGNIQAIMPASEDQMGCGISIVVDGTRDVSTARNVAFDLYDEIDSNDVVATDSASTKIICSTQLLTSLGGGSHTIKLQANSWIDGAVGWGAQLPEGKSSIMILII